MSRWLLLALLTTALAAGCAASRPPPAADCERTCQEMGDACKASCLKSVDPSGGIAGSAESCHHLVHVSPITHSRYVPYAMSWIPFLSCVAATLTRNPTARDRLHISAAV